MFELIDNNTEPKNITKFKERYFNKDIYIALIDKGCALVVADLISRRVKTLEEANLILESTHLNNLTDPFFISDMEKATFRIIRALENNEAIGIQTDYDCDGQTSHAVLFKAIHELFNHKNIYSFVGERLQDGYGLTQILSKQIIDSKVSLVITADNGSTDIESIKFLKEHNIDVIITDHHIVNTPPEDAYAFINPANDKNPLADPNIAGCMVAWLLMASVYFKLSVQYKKCMPYSVVDLLDFVAVGTLADCVSVLKSRNNRIIIKHGIALINRNERTIWNTLKTHFKKDEIDEDIIKFYIAPLLNASSRIGNVFHGIAFLLADKYYESQTYLALLVELNDKRKLLQAAVLIKAQEVLLENKYSNSNSLYIEESTVGINGIIASKILETNSKTTVIFSKKGEILTGSIRAGEHVDLFNILKNIHKDHNALLLKFGGHKKAAGISIKKTNLDIFKKIFDEYIANSLFGIENNQYIFHDGPLPTCSVSATLKYIKHISPFGTDFPSPMFLNNATVITSRTFANDAHLSLKLKIYNYILDAVFFQIHAYKWLCNIKEGDIIKIYFSINVNSFTQQPSLVIKHLILNELSTC